MLIGGKLALCGQESGGQHGLGAENGPQKDQGISGQLTDTGKHTTNVYQKASNGVHIAKIMESAVYSKFMQVLLSQGGRGFSGGHLSEYDVMLLAGHACFSTTHTFYLAVREDLIERGRAASTKAMAGISVANLLQQPSECHDPKKTGL